jgi:hypothetical protein
MDRLKEPSSGDGMKRPNLFVSGLPRSGTSSMHTYLGRHPDIYMTPIKEPNFFCRDFREESDAFHGKPLYFPYRRLDRYMDLYKGWSGEVLAGEASWTNLYSKAAAAAIHDFNPRATVLILLREPVSFLYSFHSAATFALGEHMTDFEAALEAEPLRKQGKALSKRVITPSWLHYSEFVAYADHVDRYFKLFPREQIKVVLFDDLASNAERVFSDTLAFLGVDAGFRPNFDVVNPNKILKWPQFKKAVLDSPYFRRLLRWAFRDDGYAALKNLYKNRIVSYRPRPPLPEELRDRLMRKFSDEVEKISRLLGVDLVHRWGYDQVIG